MDGFSVSNMTVGTNGLLMMTLGAPPEMTMPVVDPSLLELRAREHYLDRTKSHVIVEQLPHGCGVNIKYHVSALVIGIAELFVVSPGKCELDDPSTTLI